MSIREILNKVWGWASCGLDEPERDYKKEEFIVQAHQAILAEVEKMLPKEEKIIDTMDIAISSYAEGWNDCKDNIKAKLHIEGL